MQNSKVLICDDNSAIYKSLTGYFEEEKLDLYPAYSGNEALELIKKEAPALLILDIMLPDISGLEIAKNVKKEKDIPIIMLSAKGSEVDRIVGLEIGADDYVTKPFSPHEVAVRARKLLKRFNHINEERIMRLGSLTINPESYEAFVDSNRVTLTTREFETLRYLISRAGKVVTREHIINAVWGAEYVGEPRIVDTLIKRIRQKLRAQASVEPDFAIKTIHGVGYMAIAQ